MSNEDTWKDNEFDQEFEDDNDDEFNQDGNGWEDSDENVADPFESDPNNDNGWGDIDVDQDAASEIENEFWKGYYEKTDKHLALQSFLKVIELIENGGDDNDNFKFKSLTEIVILYFNNKADRNTVIKYFNDFLLSSNDVKPNDLSTNLRKILNTVKVNESIYNGLYDIAMKYFKPKSHRNGSIKHIWFSLGLERCHGFLDKKIFKRCEILIEELHENLRNNGNDNKSETAKLLQVYAVKIQLTMRLIDDLASDNETERDMNKYNALQLSLSELIEITQNIMTSVDITDNKSMSIIYECWAKVYASNNDWYNSYKYFKEAFLLYQQIAHKNTTKCLKYLLISFMILSSLNNDTNTSNANQLPNPFDMDEIKVYQNHNDIIIINNLLNAFESNDIGQFNKLLKQLYETDLFIIKYIAFVQLRLQGKALINLVSSYDRVKLQWLCIKLGMNQNELEKLVVKLIMDCELNGRLDQVNNILILKEKNNKQNAILNSLTSWLKTVNNLRNSINGRATQKSSVQSFGGRGGAFGAEFGMDYFHNDEDDFYMMDSAFLAWD